MATTSYLVVNGEGTTCRMGLTEQQARDIAQRLADERGEPHYVSVEGYESDDDEDLGERFDPAAA